ncbi:MAG: Fatty acid desaturase; Delta-9 fatty acid desaturase [uncultured Nocardioidaceae bacterium]|uniref:Fatty acid desaturase Delta-9 fatty acid desaturase n=1 Tax=uncultured Nocardioidaceae bacterium TaxID=253824 RepID=A0A6J4MJW7_9ACTN|nr:MAG: Fatty acid desaturase; Delta-9 fatty acid desaturase [uncultured Nocardioidaceae bacterium]
MTPATDTQTRPSPASRNGEGPDGSPEVSRASWGGDIQSRKEQIALGVFIVVPFLAVATAIPVAWGGWLGWSDVVIFAVMYAVTGHGITVGFHRLFTHKSFKPNRAVKVLLATAGSMAIQGPVIRWVADHRKHHKFSDRDGDPHSPWRYGNDIKALTKGFWHAHMMWLFNPEQTPQRKYAPDLMKDPDLVRISRQFPLWVAVSLLAPALAGGLATWSWQGAVTAFFWGSLVRVSLLHHVTWAINSICHTIGERPFVSRDKSANVWWLAIPSMGESWHNLHHADPTCARHGVLKGQVDTSARVIRVLEKLGWVHDVRWPVKERIRSKLVANSENAKSPAAAAA